MTGARSPQIGSNLLPCEQTNERASERGEEKAKDPPPVRPARHVKPQPVPQSKAGFQPVRPSVRVRAAIKRAGEFAPMNGSQTDGARRGGGTWMARTAHTGCRTWALGWPRSEPASRPADRSQPVAVGRAEKYVDRSTHTRVARQILSNQYGTQHISLLTVYNSNEIPVGRANAS